MKKTLKQELREVRALAEPRGQLVIDRLVRLADASDEFHWAAGGLAIGQVDAFIAETKQMIAQSRRTTAVEAAVPPAAGGPSGRKPTRAARSRPTPGGAPNA